MYWKEHFHKILNSNIVDENLKLSIVSTLDDIQYSEDMTVSWKDVALLTSQLEWGKSAGPNVLKLSNLLIIGLLFYCHCYLLYVYLMDISLLQ